MRGRWIPLLALPLLAQAPAKGTKAFFLQDPKGVMAACAEESMALEKDRDHGETNAEWGRAFLVAGQREQAEERFNRAAVTSQRGMMISQVSAMAAPRIPGGLPGGFTTASPQGWAGIFRRNATPFKTLDTSGISAPSGAMLQIIGCAWLRAGHVKEALAAFESMARLGPKDEDGFLKAGQDLLRAGLTVESGAMMEAFQALKPQEADNFLDYAEVASTLGHPDLTQRWCRAAVDAKPQDADVLAKAARLVAEAQRAAGPTRAPWAPEPAPAASEAPGKVWVLPAFEVTLSTQRGFFNSAADTFNALYPHREAFTQATVKRLLTALPDSALLPGSLTAATLPTQAASLAGTLGPRDVVVGITGLDVREDEVARSTTSSSFRSARLRVALYDRTGKLLAAHTFVAMMPRVFKMEKGLEATFEQMADFLAGPTFARWRE
jgi:tetratricopeptide (TPR) repeat protein